MNNIKSELNFSQRTVLHVNTVDFPKNEVPLHGIIHEGLLSKYGEEELTRQGQGVVSRVNRIVREVKKYWVVNSSVNVNKSDECNWSMDTYLWVSPVVSEDISRFISSVG